MGEWSEKQKLSYALTNYTILNLCSCEF